MMFFSLAENLRVIAYALNTNTYGHTGTFRADDLHHAAVGALVSGSDIHDRVTTIGANKEQLGTLTAEKKLLEKSEKFQVTPPRGILIRLGLTSVVVSWSSQ